MEIQQKVPEGCFSRKYHYNITINELLYSSWKIEVRYNIPDCNLSLNLIKGRRSIEGIKIGPIRKRLQKRIKFLDWFEKQKEREQKEKLKLEQRKEKLVNSAEDILCNIDSIHEDLKTLTKKVRIDPTNRERLRRIYSRKIGNTIHDMKSVYTGLISVSAYEQRLRNKIKPTEEHYWPRSSVTGKDIVDYILDLDKEGELISFRSLICLIFHRCHVNKTTSAENVNLLPFQKEKEFIDPETSYDLAGIQLIKERERKIPDAWLFILEQNNITPPKVPDFKNVTPVDLVSEI